MATSRVKRRTNRIFGWSLGLVSIWMAIWYFIIKSLFKRKSVFYTTSRPHPPLCLNDPEYGTHRYITVKNIRLHYVEAGDVNRPLVLMLHGFPEFWFSWRNQIKVLKRHFWTVSVDMRGYGDSDKPKGVRDYDEKLLVDDIKNLILALGRSSCFMIAHDFGGIIAYLVAQRYPEMIDRLIIINAPHPICWFQTLASSWRQFFKSWYVHVFKIPFLPEAFLMAEDLVFFKFVFEHSNVAAICQHDIEAYKYTFSTRDKWTGPINYYRRLFDYEKQNEMENEQYAKISVPTLIIWGCNDRAFGNELAKSSSQYFTTCTVKYIKDGGHFAHQDSPLIVNQYIQDFLKEYVLSVKADSGLARRVSKRLISSMATSASILSSKIAIEMITNYTNTDRVPKERAMCVD